MGNLFKKDEKRALGTFSRARGVHDKEGEGKGFVAIPYFAHEAEVMRMERHIKRLWVALVIAVVLLAISNLAWLWYLNQYEVVEYDYQQDGYGVNIIGDSNEVEQDGTESACEGEAQEEW